MLKIRLARGGAKKRPYYRIVVADIRSPRDGKFIEKLGAYNPLLAKDDPSRVTLKEERIKYWLSNGAQPTERMERLLAAAGLVKAASAYPENKRPRKNPGKYRKDQPPAEQAAAPAEAEAPAGGAEEAAA